MDNLIELGFAQAGTGDALTSHAQTAIAMIVGFPESITDEARADLYAGYRKRWDANHPAKLYAVIDGNYVEATADMAKNKKVEKVEIVGFKLITVLFRTIPVSSAERLLSPKTPYL